MLFVAEPFKSAWREKDIFSEVAAIATAAPTSDIFRNKEGRLTLRFFFQGKSYFLKWHRGIGWKEIFKNITQLRQPVLGARNEFAAANALNARGIDTLKPVVFAERGANPAKQESLLITEDLVDTLSLEDYFSRFKTTGIPFGIKVALIRKVATIARQMHGAGINHRDFYLCHFLLEKNAEYNIQHRQPFRCYLIDLHRCQIRNQVPRRWQEKDLAGLFFSSLDEKLSRRDYSRFLRAYTGLPLKKALAARRWSVIQEMAHALYKKEFGRAAP
jgi:heptose I phosphotransferase